MNQGEDLPQMLHESAAVERVLAGDVSAWGEIYDLYARRLFNKVLLPRLGERHAAEDALAETFRSAIEKIGTYAHRELSFYFWLSKIAHNKAMDMHRRHGAAQRKVVNLTRLLKAHGEEPGQPDDMFELAENGKVVEEHIKSALVAIHARYRAAIEMRFFQDLSREECARRLEVKLGTFDVLILRALRAFRAAYEELTLSERIRHDERVEPKLA